MEYKGIIKGHALRGGQVVIPAVTVGNLGQLALDLLIESTQAKRVGFLDHPALLPCAGRKAFDHVEDGAPAHSLEVYTTRHGTTLLQQRAPVAAGCQRMFGRDLAKWIKEQEFVKVWVLGGLDATYRRGRQLDDPQQLRLWQYPEQRDPDAGMPTTLEESWWEDKSLVERQNPPWPLVQACMDIAVPVTALLRFVTEGDNCPEAFELAGVAVNLLGLSLPDKEKPTVAAGLDGRSLSAPSSWASLFGSSQFIPL